MPDEGEPQILALLPKLGWVLSCPAPCLDYDASANLITYILRVDLLIRTLTEDSNPFGSWNS